MNRRSKIQPIQIANNVLQNSIVSSNYLQFRGGSYCIKRASYGLNKCSDKNYKYKIPCHISFMKFSTASMMEEMTAEEEPSSLHSYEKQVRMVGLAPSNCKVSRTASARNLASGDKIGWAVESNKLWESKKEMNGSHNFDRNHCSFYASNGQEQTVTKNGGYKLVLQDLGEPASSYVKYSIAENSKVLTDTERVGTQFNVSSLEISEEKVTRVNGNHSLDTAAKDVINATSATQARDQSGLRGRLCSIYEDILVVNNISLAEEVAKMLTINYRHLIHACDTEVYFLTLLTCIMFVL